MTQASGPGPSQDSHVESQSVHTPEELLYIAVGHTSRHTPWWRWGRIQSRRHARQVTPSALHSEQVKLLHDRQKGPYLPGSSHGSLHHPLRRDAPVAQSLPTKGVCGVGSMQCLKLGPLHSAQAAWHGWQVVPSGYRPLGH